MGQKLKKKKKGALLAIKGGRFINPESLLNKKTKKEKGGKVI
jgi:hypothetical protein